MGIGQKGFQFRRVWDGRKAPEQMERGNIDREKVPPSQTAYARSAVECKVNILHRRNISDDAFLSSLVVYTPHTEVVYSFVHNI